jgi:hypothetical protein
VNPDDDLIRALQSAVPRWPGDRPAPDLWPRLLRRLDDAPPRFGWFESALVGAIVILFAVFPEIVPMLLWHL